MAGWLLLLLIAHGLLLLLQGRPLYCGCGSFSPWSGDIWSRHNSQHLFDPYSFTHLLHGLLFYAALAWLTPGRSLAWRLAATVLLEVGWEQLENSPLIIERYRTATVSLGYVGDSVLNSVGDVLCCAAGFGLAAWFPVRISVALFAVVELSMLAVYRDCLLLNVAMLIWPSEAIRQWQAHI